MNQSKVIKKQSTKYTECKRFALQNVLKSSKKLGPSRIRKIR